MNDSVESQSSALPRAKRDQATWSAAVEDVVQSVGDQGETKDRARTPRRYPDSTGLVCTLILLALAAYNARYLTRSVDMLELEVHRTEMMAQVAFVAKEAEAFRKRTGDLPRAMDFGALLQDGMSYEVAGAYFRIGAAGHGLAVSYHSSVDIEVWRTGVRGAP